MAAIANKTKPSSPLPIYVIFGPEDFLRQEELHRLLDELLGADKDSMALVEFDGESADLANVLDECRTPSLLAPLRVVLVRGADEFVSGGRSQRSGDLARGGHEKKSHRELLEKYLESPSSSGVLILVCRSWPKTTRLYKLVEKIGRNIACEAPKPQAVPGWLAKRAKDAYGATLDGMAARRLSELVGSHLGLLDMELGKLATFVAPRTTISTSDVDALVGASREETIFKITDAIGQKNAAEALTQWQQILATDKAAPYRSVGGLAYAFRRLTEVKRLLSQGASIEAARSQLRIFTDTPTLKRQVDRFSLPQWHNHLRHLLKIDLGSKSGLGTTEIAMEKFIVGLCQ